MLNMNTLTPHACFSTKIRRNSKVVISLQKDLLRNYYYTIHSYLFVDDLRDGDFVVRRFFNSYLIEQTINLSERSVDFIGIVRDLNKDNYAGLQANLKME